jgi:hypothetical protein
MNLFHVVRQSMDSIWRRQSKGRGLRGQETRPGCCTTTTHLLTRHSLSVNFWRSMRQLSSPNRPTLQIWPLPTFFFVPEVEMRCERSPISDNRKDRRKFAMGPMCYPAKRVPKLEKTLEALYRQWRGVLWRRQVLLSCKLIIKCFKKKVWFHFVQTTYYLHVTHEVQDYWVFGFVHCLVF